MEKRKYHVALSFAGEDRKYVRQVATALDLRGVKVFYDDFEEADLWGKDLYTHLSDVYQNEAHFTVMFVSKSYKAKVWPNHERKSAQARALEESREYILPAAFDESVELPGLLKTIKRVSLSTRTAEEFAEFIIQKLQKSGIHLTETFSYSDEAKSDVDFPLPKGSKITKLIAAMKSYTWSTQAPVVSAVFELDWEQMSPEDAFVLGRNIYQCACGDENTAKSVLSSLRRELARIDSEYAAHLLNGMFFEVYFNHEGNFRGNRIKGEHLDNLLALQTVKKFEKSILFIRRELEPYKDRLAFRPSTEPEQMLIDLASRKSDPTMVKSVKLNGGELMTEAPVSHAELWELSHKPFTASKLRRNLAVVWFADPSLIEINPPEWSDSATKFQLPEKTQIGYPGGTEDSRRRYL